MKASFKKNVLRILGRIKHDNDSKVLYLHDTYDKVIYAQNNPTMPISRFLEMVSLIRSNGFEIVKDFTRERQQIKFCFDDGFRGLWDNREILLKEDIYPTVFIISSFVGRREYLSESEIIELDKNYGVVFQSHTANHISITDPRFTDDQLRVELEESKRFLTDLLGKDIDGFCLPRGYYNIQKLAIVKEYYNKIYSSIPGSVRTKLKGGLIARNLIQGLTDEDLESTLYGAQTLLSPYYSIKLKK